MADQKISQLSSADPLDGSERIPLEQGGETKAIPSDTYMRNILADPRDHGGVGDGSANDTAALHEAIKTGKPVFIPPGTWNDDTTFDNELDAPGMADFVFFGAGRSRSVIQWVGSNTGTAFHFTRHTGADDPRVVMVDVGAKTDAARGHSSRTVDTFTTTSTSDAGTQSEAIFVHLDTAGGEITTVDRCRFTDFGEAIRAGGNPTYGLDVTATQVQWCNIGVNLQGVVTTSRIADSSHIAKNAIGVRLRFCQQVEIADNAIQGNYGGCDIFDYQANDDIHIHGNYFEASPDVYWHAGDSSGDSVTQSVYFENNFGLSAFLGNYIKRVVFVRNGIHEIENDYSFQDGPRHIRLLDNRNNADDTPFDNVIGSNADEVVFLGYSPQEVGVEASWWAHASATSAGQQLANNTLHAVPVLLTTEPRNANALAVRVTAAGETGSVVRLGIYANNGGVPGALILDAGTVAADSTGNKFIDPIDESLSGWVWLAAVAQSASTTPPSVVCLTAPPHGMSASGGNRALDGNNKSVRESTVVDTGLPDPFSVEGSRGSANGDAPMVAMRLA